MSLCVDAAFKASLRCVCERVEKGGGQEEEEEEEEGLFKANAVGGRGRRRSVCGLCVCARERECVTGLCGHVSVRCWGRGFFVPAPACVLAKREKTREREREREREDERESIADAVGGRRQVEGAVAELVEVEGAVGELANDLLAALEQCAEGLEGGAGDGEGYGEEVGGEEDGGGDGEYGDDAYESEEFDEP